MQATTLSLILLTLILTGCNHFNTIDKNNIHLIQERTFVEANIVYKVVDSTKLHLDVDAPANILGEEPWAIFSGSLKPTLVYFHGGGWISGDRVSRSLALLPYLEKGWCVVNVDYRLLQQTNLAGCINDCLDALSWVFEKCTNPSGNKVAPTTG